MIQNFRHKGLHRFFAESDGHGIPAQHAARMVRLLDRLNAAVKPEDMDLPGYRFHSLKGNRLGDYAVSVSGNWRMTFRFDGEDATDVDLEDYH
jgi:proteic killer suppression protein